MPDRRAWLKLVVLVLLILIAVVLVTRSSSDGLDARRVAERIRELREIPFAPVLFVLAYAGLVMLALPGSSLTLAGGAVFGFGAGAALNWLGATIGALGAYALARGLGRDAIRGVLGTRAAHLDRYVADNGFLAMLRLRLIPLVPFNALNFGAGFAGVPVKEYALATALGIIPGTLIYTYFADALIAGAEEARTEAFVRLAVAGALLIGLSFLPALMRKARQ